MKSIVPAALFLLTAPAFAHAEGFESLVCRSFDYYQLHGDRKTLEISARRAPNGSHEVTVARLFESLQPDHTFREEAREVVLQLPGLHCLQAAAVDEKVISCISDDRLSYFGLMRLDSTVIASARSSRPGEIIRNTTYTAEVYAEKSVEDYQHFQPGDCGLQ